MHLEDFFEATQVLTIVSIRGGECFIATEAVFHRDASL